MKKHWTVVLSGKGGCQALDGHPFRKDSIRRPLFHLVHILILLPLGIQLSIDRDRIGLMR